MEIYKNVYPSTSKVTDHFKFIPFVVSSSDDTRSEVVNKTLPQGNLSGAEASQFYEEIISSPATSSPCLLNEHKKDRKVKKKNVTSVVPQNDNHTIFYHAQNGNIEGIKHFLSKQCCVDEQDIYGWTPLMCATFEGHYAVVEYLLKCGAKIDVKNKQGLSAFDIATMKNNKPLIELFKNGITEDTSNDDNTVEEEIKFCDLCNISYVESATAHERSIAHLLCIQGHDTSTYYHIPENNKGFQIMLKRGWDKNKGLGVNSKGRKFPIKTVLKTDRTCIGGKKELPKVTHFGPSDYSSVKRNIQPTLNLKIERKLKKRELKKLERRNRQLEIEFRRQFHFD